MNTEQREEIEKAIKDLEDSKDIGVIDNLTWPEISTLIQFARQQLSLRVDGEKLFEGIVTQIAIMPRGWVVDAPRKLEALVLQCLTTTPEEKE